MTSTKTVDDDLGTVKTTANPVASRRVLSKEDTRKIFQVSDEKRVKPPTRKVPISKAFELTSPSTRDINPQVYNGNPSSPHYHYHYNLLLYGTRGDKHKSRAMIKTYSLRGTSILLNGSNWRNSGNGLPFDVITFTKLLPSSTLAPSLRARGFLRRQRFSPAPRPAGA